MSGKVKGEVFVRSPAVLFSTRRSVASVLLDIGSAVDSPAIPPPIIMRSYFSKGDFPHFFCALNIMRHNNSFGNVSLARLVFQGGVTVIVLLLDDIVIPC